MKWNNYWDQLLVNGVIPFIVLALANLRYGQYNKASLTLNASPMDIFVIQNLVRILASHFAKKRSFIFDKKLPKMSPG